MGRITEPAVVDAPGQGVVVGSVESAGAGLRAVGPEPAQFLRHTAVGVDARTQAGRTQGRKGAAERDEATAEDLLPVLARAAAPGQAVGEWTRVAVALPKPRAATMSTYSAGPAVGLVAVATIRVGPCGNHQ